MLIAFNAYARMPGWPLRVVTLAVLALALLRGLVVVPWPETSDIILFSGWGGDVLEGLHMVTGHVLHTCGHTAKHYLLGNRSDRRHTLAWLKSAACPDCRIVELSENNPLAPNTRLRLLQDWLVQLTAAAAAGLISLAEFARLLSEID